MFISFHQGLDALMAALNAWNGGVIVISHDERFITTVAKEVYHLSFVSGIQKLTRLLLQLWVCADGTVTKFKGDVQAYKVGALETFRVPCLMFPHRVSL